MGSAAFIIIQLYLLFQALVALQADRRPVSTRRSRQLLYLLVVIGSGTSWIFYGSPSYAAVHGIEYIGLYIGIILAYTIGFPVLAHVGRVVRQQGIASISDFIGSRYGKSFLVAAVVTAIVTIGLVPYIALQVRALHYLAGAFKDQPFFPTLEHDRAHGILEIGALILWVVYYCARSQSYGERHEGLLFVLAMDTLIKFGAFVLVGISILLVIDWPDASFADRLWQTDIVAGFGQDFSFANLASLALIGAAVIVLLPSQFYVNFVDQRGGQNLRSARWFVPLSLFVMGLFVLPIVIAGQAFSHNPELTDFYFFTAPLAAGANVVSIIAFIGGVAAATSMIFLPSMLLAVSISNDIVLPLLWRRAAADRKGGDFVGTIRNTRMAVIVVVLLIMLIYEHYLSDHIYFASLALISAVALIQLLPAFVGGIFWNRATARGALWGMCGGFAVWIYTMVLPSLLDPASELLIAGPLNLSALRPEALFGSEVSAYANGLFWSLLVNSTLFVAGSLSRSPAPLERIQAAHFVIDGSAVADPADMLQPNILFGQLKTTLARYIGEQHADSAFATFCRQEEITLADDQPADFKTVQFAEHLLSEVVGPPSARTILALAMGPTTSSQRKAQILLDHATGALAQNRQLLQTALDRMDQGIAVFDSGHRLSCWNLQFQLILELPRELQRMGTPLGHILRAMFQRGDLVDLGAEYQTNDGTAPIIPWRIKMRNAEQTIEVRSNPMPGGGLVTTFTDISQAVNADELLRRTNESLEQRVRERTGELTLANQQLVRTQKRAEDANLEKTRFLAGASHDLLQPLNAARLYSSALTERLDSINEKELVRNLDSSLEAVETIISALLDISRLDTGALKPVISVFRMDALLRQVESDFMPIAREKGLELRILPTSAVVATDRNLLRRLVQNLVSNAIKYTRSGKVLVGVRRRGQTLHLNVHDTGIGIPRTRLDDIFREFTRLTGGMRESDGLGLGLSIVERIAHLLDMGISVDSTPGRGSRFAVSMAASQAQPVSVSISAPAPQKPGALAGLRVMCIDDNEASLAGMQQLLQTWGCTVTAFRSAEAVRRYCQDKGAMPEAVLADYNLDNENGLDLIGFIRGHFGGELPASLVTADRSAEVLERAARDHVTILNKPVKPAMLRALITRLKDSVAAE
ncbi:PAS-domain containing protein [Phyllobacterium sp. 21LDTY02-6]|uniref:hybrid sensor histidine kinase/response regulator n=1 Tax=Phyllobacterium sp. 21LDTY02-6 TaxID=2944903 RepID=UPI002020FD03|nr:PAS-domain containing protein [Phyllobacterium sp. 21LDTY02-6]MCO4318779.1 PAS-domain containing protein [Phyllobacterium sp. 21LDTY02-6]